MYSVPEGKKCVEVRKYDDGKIKIREVDYEEIESRNVIKKLNKATLLFVPKNFMKDELSNEKIRDAIKSYVGNASDLSDLKESLEKFDYKL